MKLADLKPNRRNPRRMSADKKKDLKASMKEFWDLACFIYNVELEEMGGAHQRASVSPKNSKITITKEYAKPTPAGTVREGVIEIDGENHKYREVRWNRAKHTAATIAANRHSGEWDQALLKEDVNNLVAQGFDMKLTGLDEYELDSMVEAATKLAEEIKAPEFELTDEQKTAHVEDQSVDFDPTEKRSEPESDDEPTEDDRESAFGEVVEKNEVKGKKFVIILECPDAESKVKLRDELHTLVKKYGAKIF